MHLYYTKGGLVMSETLLWVGISLSVSLSINISQMCHFVFELKYA